MKATTKERRDKKALSGYLRCCRVDLIGVCGLRGHKTGRQARDEGGRLNTPPPWRRTGVKNAREHNKKLGGWAAGCVKKNGR